MAITAEKACKASQIMNLLFATGASPAGISPQSPVARTAPLPIPFCHVMRINRRISPTDASYPTGMMFFPTKMMEGYKAGTFKGDGNTFFLFAMGIFGLSIMGAMVTNSTMMRPSASKKAQGVQCLANCMYWTMFLLSDGSKAVSGSMPKAFSGDALPQIYGNLGLFAVLAVVNYLGWTSAGSPTPDTSNIVPSGALKTTLIANFVNLGFFGIGCKFFTETFIDMYIPGVVAGINKGSPDADGSHLSDHVQRGHVHADEHRLRAHGPRRRAR